MPMRRRSTIAGSVVALATIVVVSTGGPASAAPQVVGLWHMDETSGTVMNDSSSFGNDGTLEHITFVENGRFGGAYSFNGTNSIVMIPNHSSLNPGTADIRLSAHINVSVPPTPAEFDYDIIRKKAQGRIYKMEVLYTGTGYCQFKGTTNNGIVKGGPVVTDGRWHHLVCERTANRIALIVDGVVVKSKSISVGSISNTSKLVIGGKADRSDDWFRGLMDEVSITFG